MKRKRLAGAFIAAGAAVAIWAAPARAQFGPAPVALEPAVRKVIRRSVELSGTAEARRQSVLAAEVAGRVEAMVADEGDFVRAGEPVCQLRRLPVELELAQARGQLQAAAAALAKMTEGYREEEIRQAQAAEASARASLARWEQEYERTKNLLAEGASTPAEMDAVEASYRQAKEAQAAAKASLDLVTSGYRVEDIEQARGQAAAQDALVKALEDRLAKMTIAMPYDGFVVRKHCEAGEWVSVGNPVAEVVDLGVVRVALDVPERYLGGVVKGAPAPVVVGGLEDREFAGTVSQVVPYSEEATHTATVRVDVANETEGDRPVIAAGMLAHVWLPVGEEHEALLVPKDAVIRQGGVDLVYTVTDRPPAAAAARESKKEPTAAEREQMAEMAERGALIAKKAAEAGVAPAGVKFAAAIRVKIVGGYGAWMEVEAEGLAAGTPLVVRGTYLLSPGAAVVERPKEGAARLRPDESGLRRGEGAGE